MPELEQNIRKFTRQAYPAANSDLIDTLALDHFIDSLLDSEIRIRLRECSPKNIQEAETLAVKMEAQRIADWQRNKNMGSVAETSDKSDVSVEISKITQTISSLMDKVKKLQKDRDPEISNIRVETFPKTRQILQKIGYSDLIPILTIEIDSGETTGKEMTDQAIRLGITLQGLMNKEIMHLTSKTYFHANRETKTCQVKGPQLDQ